MRRPRSSSFLGFVVTAVIAVPSAAFVMQHTLAGNPGHKMELTSSTGAVSISNSQDGKAILTAAPMIPGTQTTGTVHLVNTGDSAETLSLDSGAPTDTPGPGGGRLSTRLQMRVEDVSSDAGPVVVYNGSLTGLHAADLGTWDKNEGRTYRFVVTFPDGGANGADNAYQGSSASIGFTWSVSASGPVAPPASAPLDEQVAGDSPTTYWPLDGSQAEMTDAVGGHDGQFANSITTAPGTAPGGGHASLFDGATGYGYVSGLAAPTEAYTMEAWVRPASAADMVILDHGNAGAIAIRSGHFAFRQVNTTLRSDTAVVVDQWQQVVGTWDASSGTARLYVDGRLSATAASTTAPSGSSTFYIGRGNWVAGSGGSTSTSLSAQGSTSFFNGAMAQVAYYPASLAASRVAAHWDAGKVEPTPTTTTPTAPPTTTGPGQSSGTPAPTQSSGGGGTIPTTPSTGTGIGGQVGTGTTPATGCPAKVQAQARRELQARNKARELAWAKAHGGKHRSKAAAAKAAAAAEKARMAKAAAAKQRACAAAQRAKKSSVKKRTSG
jgi:hypothetical protein